MCAAFGLCVDHYLAGCDGRAGLTKGPKWANHGSLMLLLFVLDWQRVDNELPTSILSMMKCTTVDLAALPSWHNTKLENSGRSTAECRSRGNGQSGALFPYFFSLLARLPTATRRHPGAQTQSSRWTYTVSTDTFRARQTRLHKNITWIKIHLAYSVAQSHRPVTQKLILYI